MASEEEIYNQLKGLGKGDVISYNLSPGFPFSGTTMYFLVNRVENGIVHCRPVGLVENIGISIDNLVKEKGLSIAKLKQVK